MSTCEKETEARIFIAVLLMLHRIYSEQMAPVLCVGAY